MNQVSPYSTRLGLLALLLAIGFTAWVNVRRIQQIEHIAELSRGASVPSATSPTGYSGGIRERIMTDHEGRSYEWIAQTQHAMAQNQWRVREIMSENAPDGRPTHAASLYRWWLSFLAWVDHQITDQPLGRTIERTPLFADPLLHGLIILSLGIFTLRQFGATASHVFVLGAATLFPFAAWFLPGIVDDASLGVFLALGSILPLLAGLPRPVITRDEDLPATASPSASPIFWFILSGIVGGVGFWISPATQAPVTIGVAAAGLLIAWLHRSQSANQTPHPSNPWRYWSLSGAVTVLLASLIEFYPDHLGAWELRVIHPLYGLAWLGGGEILARVTDWILHRKTSWKPIDVGIGLLALLALLSLPIAIFKTGNPAFLAADVLSLRLTQQPDGILAASLAAWIKSDGFNPAVWTTLLPLLILGPAVGLLLSSRTERLARSMITLSLGPVLAVFGLAYFQLSKWLLLDGTLLVVAVAVTFALSSADVSKLKRGLWLGLVVAVFLPGMLRLIPSKKSLTDNTLTVSEAIGLAERDLAHWLAKRTGHEDRPIVLAPPNLTTTLNYYGGLRGLGTLSWENQEGLAFAARIVISTSRAESAALLRRRGVTYIVIPSWDRYFESIVNSASHQIGELFYKSLNRWILPPWLKPVPYHLPIIPGFEKQYVNVFEVVDDQDEPVAASRLTEYFLEMGQLENARLSEQTLLKYPADFGVLIARSHLYAALQVADNFTRVFEPLLTRLANGDERYLPWDRRVSLAVVLARGNRMELAGVQVKICLRELTETRLRSLSTHSLYHLLVLVKAVGAEFSDQPLHALALELLPLELRQQI